MVGGAFFVFLYPVLVNASIFSNFLRKTATPSSAATSGLNSQNVLLLAPAKNIDPTPAVGGGDIVLVGGTALLAQEGPSGTVIDIENHPTTSQISVYTVRTGDTLDSVAELFDVSVNTILWANDLQKGVLKEGQVLVILPITGIQHKVTQGDTITNLAQKYKSDARDIAQYNNFAEDEVLSIGSTIIIPDGVVPAPAKTTVKKTAVVQKQADKGYYVWPVAGGRVTQGIHGFNGVDIGFSGSAAAEGTPILAAASGVVIVARDGGQWNGGYGNYIVIKHPNGTQTLYAHAQTGSVAVSVGSTVAQGQVIAGVGQTGKATGLHLHFEVRGAKNPFGK